MNVLKNFNTLNDKLTDLLEENKNLRQQHKNVQEENQEFKKKLKEREERETRFHQHVLSLNKQHQELKEREEQFQQHILNLDKQNQELKEREKQFQQHVLYLESQKKELEEKVLIEKQKNKQLEMISQSLEKTLGKLGLDIENDIEEKNRSLIDKPTTFPPIGDNDDSIQPIEDSPERLSNSFNKGAEKSDENPSRLQSSFKKCNIRVVVGLDFGTTYSGFSCCNVANQEDIFTNDQWHGEFGFLKTSTVLQYDEDYNNVKLWGAPALIERPSRRKRNYINNKPVELFKLHLSNLLDHKKPILPDGFDYTKAISDYLREIGKVIKETLVTRWPKIDFYENVLLVLTVPAEFNHNAIHIMRECAYKAELINDKNSTNLQFTTEPEAAAIYCMRNLKEHSLAQPGTNFMVVDCGGGTVDLTTRKLLENGRSLGEITERYGDYCGSTFIDAEFIKYLGRKVGSNAIDLLRRNHYGQMQYMVQTFCRKAKLPFTGDDPTFMHEIDLEDVCPVLKQYVSGRERDNLEDNDWIIDLDFNTIKSMFEPIIKRIISLVRMQLQNPKTQCSAIFLVGGFSESKYLQKRIKEEFRDIVVSVPSSPIATISRGAVMYGSFSNVISTRVLKYTYGIKIRNYWMKRDPIERKLRHGLIDRFHCLATRGTEINVNEKIETTFTPLSSIQTIVTFSIYYSPKRDIKYCDEPDVMLLGTLTIDIPVSGLNCLDHLLFEFTFGTVEIDVNVKNKRTGRIYRTTFALDI